MINHQVPPPQSHQGRACRLHMILSVQSLSRRYTTSTPHGRTHDDGIYCTSMVLHDKNAPNLNFSYIQQKNKQYILSPQYHQSNLWRAAFPSSCATSYTLPTMATLTLQKGCSKAWFLYEFMLHLSKFLINATFNLITKYTLRKKNK